MQGLRLYKAEKLCSRTAVETLFAQGKGRIAYPLRAVYRVRPAGHPAIDAQFLITIPKKRLRHAVDRVRMRRRVREAYRLHRRQLLHPVLEQTQLAVDIAFVYLDNALAPYGTIENKMQQLLVYIAHAVANHAERLSETQSQQS